MTTGLTAALVWMLMVASSPPPQGHADSLPATTLPLRLTGVLAGEGAAPRATCVIRCGISPERGGVYGPGEQACGLAEVRDIRPDGVVLLNLASTRLEWLTFSKETQPRPGPTSAESVASPSTPRSEEVVAREVPKATVARYAANLPELLSSALATPRYREGPGGLKSIEGFEITQVESGGAVDQLGIRSGDVVTAVNGQPLDGMPSVMRLFSQVQSVSEVRMTVLRNGQRVTLVFNTR